MKKIKLIETGIGEIEQMVSESEADFVKSKGDQENLTELFDQFAGQNKLKLFSSIIESDKIGFISLFLLDESVVSIGPMYISRKFRGKGYGQLQVDEILNYCRDSGYKKIKTKTWGKNIASRKIFENLGFKQYEEELNNRVNGDSTVKFIREL